MNLLPLISTFGIIAIAELGDKTQLAAITLSARYQSKSVFAGAILAMALVNGVSILAGTALGELIPMQLVGLIAAAVFIGFGIITLLSKEVERVKIKHERSAILTSFMMISLMELGDKTQFSVIALAAEYNAPTLVFIGAILAYLLLMGIAVVVGNKLLRLMRPRYLKIFTGTLFIIFGLVFLLGAVGISF